MKRTTNCLLASAAAVTLSLAALTLPASAGVGMASDCSPPGHYETDGDAWYCHQTDTGSHVQIRVSEVTRPAYHLCVGPGNTYLGRAGLIDYAGYTGNTC